MSTLQTTTTTLRHGPANRNSLRTIASIVGWLFIVTYVTSIAAKVAFYPPLFDGDYVTGPGQDTRVLWGAVFEAVLIIANIGSATFLWPVLKRQHESLAMSFVAARIMESVFIAAGIIFVLGLVSLRQDSPGATDLAVSLAALKDWTFLFGPGLVVPFGNGLLLGYLMYTSGLVPRWMTWLGLIGGPVLLVQSLGVLFDWWERTGAVALLVAPEFLWELLLGIYAAIWGFRRAAPILSARE